MFRRPRLARVAPTLTALSLLAAAFAWQWRSRPDLSNWDESRLTRELESFGYHVHFEPCDREGALLPTGYPRAVLAGVYAYRGEPADWDEIASRLRGDPWAWRGCVVATRGGHPAPEDGGYLAAGPWVFLGDPAELGRVARHLGLPR
jgi:hypothetical protein